jgi:exopolysaccharide production protein ExoZ
MNEIKAQAHLENLATPPRSENLITLQALRAIAALFVVSYHILELASSRLTGSDIDQWGNGASGVDIFFVISGLVMMLSTQRLTNRAHAGPIFLLRRFCRIVPLYWLVTTVKIAAVMALPALVVRTTQLNLPYVMASFALLPVHDAAGAFKPVLPVGWTLTYEMFFYLLVASALSLRVTVMRIAAPVLGLIYLMAAVRQPFWPNVTDFADPIVLEFLYGGLIGLAWRHGRSLPNGYAAILLLGGTASIVTIPVISGLMRPFVWGIPAAMMVAGAVALEPVLARRLPRLLLILGDASYSIYLTHGLVIPAVWLVVRRLGISEGASLAAMTIGGLVACAIAGWLTYVVVERPIIALFRRPGPLSKIFDRQIASKVLVAAR